MSRLKLFAASVLAAGAMGGLAYASGGGGEGMGSLGPVIDTPILAIRRDQNKLSGIGSWVLRCAEPWKQVVITQLDDFVTTLA